MLTLRAHHKASSHANFYCTSQRNSAKEYKYIHPIEYTYTQCLKITEKVAFKIASDASYLYILSGQKFIKNAKNSQSKKW